MNEFEMCVAGYSVMVRDVGVPTNDALLYFHGTPGSRLDVAFGDHVAAQMGVRVVSFDRPGYGRSEPAPFGLTSIAKVGEGIADGLGLERVAAVGWSGGGPFALAASTIMGERVGRVGVASGPAPFQQFAEALATLSDVDREALSFLPADPARAAEVFRTGADGMIAAIGDEEGFMVGVDALFAGSDGKVLADPGLRKHLFVMLSEGLLQGSTGIGWDNVAWVGPWDIDLALARRPVHLWYGGRDAMSAAPSELAAIGQPARRIEGRPVASTGFRGGRAVRTSGCRTRARARRWCRVERRLRDSRRRRRRPSRSPRRLTGLSNPPRYPFRGPGRRGGPRKGYRGGRGRLAPTAAHEAVLVSWP